MSLKNEKTCNYKQGVASVRYIMNWGTTTCVGVRERTGLDEFLGLEEALEVPHLPDAHEDEDDGLPQRPPQHSSIGAVADLPEPLFTLLHK